jgi:type IV secretory pathway VirB2 component (pilin)
MNAGTSLFAPPEPGVLLPAVQWIEGALLGSLATIIAILAIAGIGFTMLSGRIALRRTMSVILGCFVLLGAGSIARGLITATQQVMETKATPANDPYSIPTRHARPTVAPRAPSRFGDDPNAGAAVQH